MSVGRCARCHANRQLEELLLVADRRQPWRRRYVCRPLVTGGTCFRYGTASAQLERIEPAIASGPAGPANP